MEPTVDGNRVTIDESVYVVKPAGTDRFAVYNDFGEALGYFSYRGKTIMTDDYHVSGAHSMARIGRIWRDAQASGGAITAPLSRMVCEVIALGALQPEDIARARAHRKWLKTQPGLKAVFYAQDAATGKALALRVWSSRAQLEAHQGRTPPPEAADLPATSVEVLGLIDDL